MQEMERLGGVGQTLERERGDDGGIAGGRILFHGLHFKQGGMQDPVATELPAGNGHGFYQSALIGGFGLKLCDEGIHHVVEDRGGFGLQHDAARELVVAAGVFAKTLACLLR